jgi:hypothetical protein
MLGTRDIAMPVLWLDPAPSCLIYSYKTQSGKHRDGRVSVLEAYTRRVRNLETPEEFEEMLHASGCRESAKKGCVGQNSRNIRDSRNCVGFAQRKFLNWHSTQGRTNSEP